MFRISGISSPAGGRVEAPDGPSWWNRPRLRWGKVILLIFIALWAAGEGISLLIQHSRLRGKLTARLEASFGRPVQVGEYAFSFWDGPAIEARGVSVAENPRFGHEYFLRSESLSVRLGWQSLLRGHLELGTLSLDCPSLNLVRNASGEWNLAAWLPRPSGGFTDGPRGPPSAPSQTLRFRRIEVSGGRINFKRGDDKLPFAFVDVNGSIGAVAPGSWRLHLEATPWRAAAITQEAGTIRLSGRVGGTSSRLRPAGLDISWTDASVSDLFRLLRGDDSGIRGAMSLAISARTDPRQPLGRWIFQGRAELRQLHRWDLPLRADDPAVNIVVRDAQLDLGQASLAAPEVLLEAPHSSAHGGGVYTWAASPGAGRAGRANPGNAWTASSFLDLRDVLAWIRAFHPGLHSSLSLQGQVETRMDFSGWPPRLAAASATGPGAEVVVPGLRKPAHLGPMDFRYDRGSASLRPVALWWGSAPQPPQNSLQIEALERRGRGPFPAWHVFGKVNDAGDFIATAKALGANLSADWQLQGPFACDLRWQGVALPWQAPPVGTIDIGAPGTGEGPGASLRLGFLNLPIEKLRAHAELKSDARRVTLLAAQALGGRWSGKFNRRPADPEWHFELSADRLSASSLDRWLDPRWRESFLGRMLPFLGSKPAEDALPDRLRASGSLSLGQFTLAPLVASRVKAHASIEGRRVALTEATGQFYGGSVRGSFRAALDHPPSYHANLSFSSVRLADLAESSRALAGLFSGTASGELSLDAQGTAREDLLASLSCSGNARVSGGAWRAENFSKMLDGEAPPGKTAAPLDGSAALSCARRKIDFQTLTLEANGIRAQGMGAVDFNRTLDLRFEVRGPADAPGGAHDASYRLRGSLAAPRIEPLARSRRSP